MSVPPFKTLSLLVENMGRIGYGPHLHDYKGILGSVKVGGRILSKTPDWSIWTLPLNNTATGKFKDISANSGEP